MDKTTYFDYQNNLCSDSCWMDFKNHGNDKILNYSTYEQSSQLLPCEAPKVRVPDFMLDHPNLRGRAGYGLAESCLVDTYSDLLMNNEKMTRDRCRIQLNTRVFTGVPQLKGCELNPSKELELLTGDDTTYTISGCKKRLMELQLKHPIPLVDCMKDIQNPNNIVPVWTNGGEDTRSYINRMNFNKNYYK
jgi:hypothetical protein